MFELKPLKFNEECIKIYQSGGFDPEKDWWMIAVGAIVLIILISLIVSFSNKSNANSRSVTVSKKTINGEDIYYKEVDGEEEDLSEAEKLKYDQMFEDKMIEEPETELELDFDPDDIINDSTFMD